MSRADEVREAVESYVETRRRIAAGEEDWTAMADLFTDDAVYVDPAWGRIEGADAIRRFMDESMRGLEDWEFPIEFTAIAGDDVAIKWTQILPSTLPDGTHPTQSGWSRLRYAGGGKFDYGEDMLNMVHVLEDLRASRWRPGEGFVPVPEHPDRSWMPPR